MTAFGAATETRRAQSSEAGNKTIEPRIPSRIMRIRKERQSVPSAVKILATSAQIRRLQFNCHNYRTDPLPSVLVWRVPCGAVAESRSQISIAATQRGVHIVAG